MFSVNHQGLICIVNHPGVNVRQHHYHDHIELIFDVMLKWADDRDHATVSIQAASNTKWTAQQAVAATAELHHVQVSYISPHLLQSIKFSSL